MTQIRTDILDDFTLAALPRGRRSRSYYLGSGLHVVVLPDGRRKFVVYDRTAGREGWMKSRPHLIGCWPTISLKKAREYAAGYQQQRKTRRRSTAESTTMQPCKAVLLQDALHPPWTPEDDHNED